MTTQITKEQAITAGGKEWNGTRVYFNGLLDLAKGVEINFYGTGNVSNAQIDGSIISNTKARPIAFQLQHGKVWLDIESGKLNAKDMDQEIAHRVFRGIRAKIV